VAPTRRRAFKAAPRSAAKRPVDTGDWEYYARHPAARGARLAKGAARAAYAERRARRLARRGDAAGASAVRAEAGARVADVLIAVGPTYVAGPEKGDFNSSV
jgi:hypothetical protein